MVIFLLVSGTFLASQEQEKETVTIASFNIRIFSTGSRDDYELHNICMLLKEYDFIAIQEVRDLDILERTVSALNTSFGLTYRYIVSPELGRSRQTERYAFFYRPDTFTFLGTSGVFQDRDDRFIREPFYGKFSTGTFDFFAVTVHLIYGNSLKQRRAESLVLDDVYSFVLDLDDEEDILIMGDFNLPPDDEGFREFRDDLGLTCVNGDIPTSIRDNLYDNIWLSPSALDEYTGRFGVNAFDETMFFGYDDYAGRIVSDHRPVWAEFSRY